MQQPPSRLFCYGPGLSEGRAITRLGPWVAGPVQIAEYNVWSAAAAPGSSTTGGAPPSWENDLPDESDLSGEPAVVEVSGTLLEAPRKLFILDVDSTLIEQEVIELLAGFAGKEAEVREVTEAAMRGELDFEQSLRSRVAQLAGLPVTVLSEAQEVIRLSPGAAELITGAHAAGHRVAAVSGGFQQILQPLSETWNLDASLANELGVREGRLTGEVTGTIVDRAMKATMLREWAREFGIPVEATIAIGDGANDLEMLAAAGLSLGYRAKPAVRAAVDATISRLDLALPLSGTEIRQGGQQARR